MTANHAHTPDKGDLKKAWDWYRANQDKQSGIEQNFRTYRFEFLRAWDAIEAAAEQRGAERAFRKTQEIVAGCFEHTIDEARERYDMINTGYLIQEIDTEIQDLQEDDDE